MGIVTANKLRQDDGTPITDADDRRRLGVRDLGREIFRRAKRANNAREYAIAVERALNAIIDAQASGNDQYELLYRYVTADPTDPDDPNDYTVEETITAPTRNKREVRCTLVDANGNTKELVLTIKTDQRDDEKFEMDVVFPEAIDNNNFDYLSIAAADIQNFANPNPGRNYLTAFKFLSRCA